MQAPLQISFSPYLSNDELSSTLILLDLSDRSTVPWSANPLHIHTWIYKNPRISTWTSMIFGCQPSTIHTNVDMHTDIQAGISMQGDSEMDIYK